MARLRWRAPYRWSVPSSSRNCRPSLVIRNKKGRVLDSTTRPFLFRITSEGRQFLLEEGTDQRYGARHLKRAIERYLVYPLSRLLATAQVRSGDVLLVDRHPGDKGLAFLKNTEKRSSYAPFTAPNLSCLAAAEV